VSAALARLPRILIVEDDARLATLLEEYLNGHGYEAGVESRGDRAVERIWRENPALVVLDLMLPGMNGFDVCRRARERYARGILMLTASKAEVDQAVGFELGADDYVVKPVEPRILLARVRSLLRRLEGPTAVPAAPETIIVGPLSLDRGRRQVAVAGLTIDATGVEFDLLWLLARRAGEVVSRDEMSLQVRGIPYDGVDRGIDVHVSRLRRKLEAAGLDAANLKSVRGYGYLLLRS
jgi:DNA-binding response OmpR family regulator